MAKQLKKTKSDITIPYTNAGGDVLNPGAQTYMAIATHGMMPAKLPNQNGSQLGLPGYHPNLRLLT